MWNVVAISWAAISFSKRTLHDAICFLEVMRKFSSVRITGIRAQI
jgi:hypothetical protein